MPGPYNELEKKAENLEQQSKLEFNKKNYITAIALLEDTKDMYSELGFHGKVRMISQQIGRIKNLIKFKTQDSEIRTKSEEAFQERVEKVISEKKDYEHKKSALQSAPSPEIKRKFEKIQLLIEKAEREEKLGKISRVIDRYQYILKLYRTIPYDIMDLTKEILKVEQKLSNLQN